MSGKAQEVPVPTQARPPAFRPRARIMKTLGAELISSDTVAVIELVKNGYDAGASAVLIRFVEPLRVGEGSIEVIDNGSGMDASVVRGAWMEPATPSKRSTKFLDGRRVLGEKGIGRFAASRLASGLDLSTRVRGSREETHVFFDWTQFEDEERFLDEIIVHIEQRPASEISETGSTGLLRTMLDPQTVPDDFAHGTTLKLERLAQTWTRRHFEDLERGLSRLVSPFAAPGDFKIRVQAEGQFSDFSKEIAPPETIRYPNYSLEGTIGADGACSVTMRVEATGHAQALAGRLVRTTAGWVVVKAKGNAPDPAQAPRCGPLFVSLRIWDRDDLGNVEQKTGATLTSIRHDLDAFAGINLYRDDFRVMPYGEPKNDWLRLDMRRVQNPTTRLSNNQIVGYVAITADANPALQDQSNREGIREGDAFTDLQGIVLALLAKIESVRKVARKAARKDAPGGTPREGGLFAPVDLGALRAHLRSTPTGDRIAEGLLDDAERSYQEQITGIKEVVARYQSLVALGTLMDVVLHDGRQPLSKIASEALLGKEDLDEAVGDGPLDLARVRKRFVSIGDQGEVLKAVFRRIEPFAGRKRGRPRQLVIEDTIRAAFEVHDTQIRKLGVDVVLPETRTMVSVDGAEIQQVLLNLLGNSLFWLETVPAGNRKISVEIARPEEGVLEVSFADSGPGVPESLRASIFDPYFSTRPDGVGLGLAIAGGIVTDFYGGKLELMDTSRLGGAEFRITLKKRT